MLFATNAMMYGLNVSAARRQWFINNRQPLWWSMALCSMILCAGVPLGCSESGLATWTNAQDKASQFSASFHGARVHPRILLVVVDDAPTPAARALRRSLANELSSLFDAHDQAFCGMSEDPANYRPVDWQLVLLGSSGTTGAITALDDARLHMKAVDASADVQEAFSQAGAEALLQLETDAEMPFDGVAQLTHWVHVLTGEVSPKTPKEEAMVARLAERVAIYPYIATTRADTGTGELLLFAPPQHYVSFVKIAIHSEEGCPQQGDEHTAFPRLSEFAPHDDLYCWEELPEKLTLLGPHLVGSCSLSCMPRYPEQNTEGRAAGRVLGYFPADERCKDHVAWSDPLGSDGERHVEFAGPIPYLSDAELYRVCELRQLEGAALRSCRLDADCADCKPGWCFAEPEGVLLEFGVWLGAGGAHAPTTYCEEYHGTPNWSQLRLTYGVDQGPLRYRVVFDGLATPDDSLAR